MPYTHPLTEPVALINARLKGKYTVEVFAPTDNFPHGSTLAVRTPEHTVVMVIGTMAEPNLQDFLEGMNFALELTGT